MTNKASNQQNDIWGVITKGLVEAVKMVFSILASIVISGSNSAQSQNVDEDENNSHVADGMRDGHNGPGYYVGDIKVDNND